MTSPISTPPHLACPHCGRDAPIVFRGAVPCCTACGGVRQPLSSPSVNLAGKPSKVGGAVASVIGWLVLIFGLSTALGLGLVLNLFFSSAFALAIALPVSLVTLVAGIVLLKGGRALSRSGADAEQSTRERALLELAAHRGSVTAADAARALGIPVNDADAALTTLAKREPERVAVDVDEYGVVRYRAVVGLDREVDPRVRVAGNVRVDGERADDPLAEEGEGEARGELRR